MGAIELNQIQIEAIKSRAERGLATNVDCLDLVRYIDSATFTEDWVNKVSSVILIPLKACREQYPAEL